MKYWYQCKNTNIFSFLVIFPLVELLISLTKSSPMSKYTANNEAPTMSNQVIFFLLHEIELK